MIYHIPSIFVPVCTALAIWHQLTKYEIPELSKPSVIMRDRQRVEEMIQSMHRAGPGGLQVISDFDMTLTRFAYNGQRCPTSHNILDNSKLISEDCKKSLKELLNKYYPIEIDSSRTVEEKLPHMVEWWTKAHNLLIQQKIRKDLLAQVVQESEAMLRDGYKEFFDHLRDLNVPLLIFSAGLGDVVEEVVRQKGLFHSNVRVFSNYMDFDENGILRAFKGQLIHTYNKREGALLNEAHFHELKDRHNVLLLGDSLGDLTMADGVQNVENVLKIGYLNDKVEERKESYLASYDIVLERDETMDLANAILRHVSGGQ
ncbi:7-methylguanosine phosphate-specific 5'-nucleotidase-like isoform X1 [Conger conger]|uniref:7-methylguanosine phosphate-specific 5'-nucleotidase-like isoform X1 n=1 Tax=Conger conger TaxID=82655 RepID=UPI002A59BB9C|nr:7-methylguanosine phosphate-specific 5'-nucleotidase-like isoform X1 [Conger conger]